MLNISVQDARHLHLAAQGLLSPPRKRAGKADVLAAIVRMALLQIDTISVVARSPYFVLWSRLGDYTPAWLDELLHEGELFEYWAHEACYVPIADYRLLRHRMLDPAGMGWKYSARWIDQHQTEIADLLQHVRTHGPVRAADFSRPAGQTGSGWWDWKPEKRHLEALFTCGELMVAARHNFQRIYELRERVLPHWNDARDLPAKSEAHTEMIRRSCRALGIVRPGWVADYYRLRRTKYDPIVHSLADAGELLPVQVKGWSHDSFIHRDLLAELERPATFTTLLSPFDPVVWDRKRAAELWDFDYRIECYTPAAKRRFGYFVLPLLHRGKLVGRVDAKAHRQAGIFEIKALYLESGINPGARLQTEISAALTRCARWHGTPKVQIGHSELSLNF